ncbi:hypothetical protein DICPUDRAFT_97330 [Dictyostelium purpureum]|uniref:G8 domain-containing protein n=1 Tax=Dictyostelium purpureum TaxID=5786 RepID=F0ZFT2_DICPU|nr:uncharacterized protein DICPUDRAFT_97330 [Dictyostelium purpureum]EGC37229.1 hypothetical protein DICPUDRAFT_97330 [Dictyostelium purpureum]|eukprot:XP_003286280.1 hypothetical protein DICPUDRAFT_97330 [Dictyostelium purpureum]
MKLLLNFIILIFSIIQINGQLSSFSLDLNTRVNINGHPHFKLDYFPGTTNTNYKGNFIPDVETNTAVKKFTFTQSCTVTITTNFITNGFLSPAPTSAEFVPAGATFIDANSALIIPHGITVTFSGTSAGLFPAVIVKGKIVLNPSVATSYSAMKTIIMPGGTFESIPTPTASETASYNHTLRFGAQVDSTTFPSWDPMQTNALICLGCTFRTQGAVSTPVWFGNNATTYPLSYGGKFLRDSTFTDATPVAKMVGSVSGNVLSYTLNRSFNTLVNIGSTILDAAGDFTGAGYLFTRTYSRNVVFLGTYRSSLMFTGNSTVDIQNSMFTDVGHTTTSPFSETVLDSSYQVTSTGTNPSDRYPITLLHNTVAVNIQNNVFIPSGVFGQGYNPRTMIGAKRSFGTIKNNSFLLFGGTSGISLLHGTEQFDISHNCFISTYSDTTNINTATSFREYPDINYLNGGIITTSPYSTYNNNAFEGIFKGGAIQAIPIQNRATTFGFTSEYIAGSSTLLQNNVDYKSNNVWNNLVFTNNFFAGETEVRFYYPTTLQPPLSVRFLGGWFINHRASTTLSANVANVELIFDSSIIQGTLSKNDAYTGLSFTYLISNSLRGTYNSVSLKNVYSPSSYQFFSSTFQSKYLSIINSIFAHSNTASDTFLSGFSSQTYFENLNSTKLYVSGSVSSFSPFYGFSISSTTNEVGAIPNFDSSWGSGQTVKLSTNNVAQLTSNIYTPPYIKYITPVTQTPTPPSSGQFPVVASSAASTTAYGGSYFATTLKLNAGSLNFYLGINLTPDVSDTSRALSIFGKSWTKCGWINSICSTTGTLSKVATTPTSIQGTAADVITAVDELSMLSSYLINTVSTSVNSVVNVVLPASSMFRFYIYTYNPSYTSDTVNALPRYGIKVNGKYQEPFTQSMSPYQKYQKIGPFYWNNDLTTTQALSIEWAYDNLKFEIPICGIEIYSSISTPYTIPVGTSGAEYTPGETIASDNEENEHSNSSAPSLNNHYTFIILGLLILFIQI